MDNNSEKIKKEVLKLLGMIGIDTRFISYTPNTIYINDQRFSKFSKKRQETFRKYYPDIEVISSTIFQKICTRVSKVLSSELSPKDNVLVFKGKTPIDSLLKIVLEPYTRKYGIKILESDYFDYDKIAIDSILVSLTLDEEVESILANIFSGNGVKTNRKKNYNEIKIIYPFINVSNDWIYSFLNTESVKGKEEFNIINLNSNNDLKIKNIRNNENIVNNENIKNNENIENIENNENNENIENNENNENIENNENNIIKEKNKDSAIIAEHFMEFLEEIIPQYKENILKSALFIEKKSINNK